MAFTRAQATQLLNKSEMRLFDDSRANALRQLDRTALAGRVERSREARNRARDLLKRQRQAARKRGEGKDASIAARTARKEELLAEILQRFVDARKAAPAARPAKAATTRATPTRATPTGTASKKAGAKKAAARKTPAGKTASKSAGKTASKSAGGTASKAATKVASKRAGKTASKATSNTAGKAPSKSVGKTASKSAGARTTAAAAKSVAKAPRKSAATSADGGETGGRSSTPTKRVTRTARKSTARSGADAAAAPDAPATTRSASRRKTAKLTPERALENTRQLLEAKQERDRTPQPWQELDPTTTHVPEPGYQSPEAESKALELHEGESRVASIQGSMSTRDRRNQGKRDQRNRNSDSD